MPNGGVCVCMCVCECVVFFVFLGCKKLINKKPAPLTPLHRLSRITLSSRHLLLTRSRNKKREQCGGRGVLLGFSCLWIIVCFICLDLHPGNIWPAKASRQMLTMHIHHNRLLPWTFFLFYLPALSTHAPQRPLAFSDLPLSLRHHQRNMLCAFFFFFKKKYILC